MSPAPEPVEHCRLHPDCRLPPHEPGEVPCPSQPVERAGEPCRYCGEPCPPSADNPAEGHCTDCWTPITIPLAKAMFAEYGLSVDPRTGEGT